LILPLFSKLEAKIPHLSRSEAISLEAPNTPECVTGRRDHHLITKQKPEPLKNRWGEKQKKRRPMGFQAGQSGKSNQAGLCHQNRLSKRTRSQRRRIESSAKAPLGHAHQIRWGCGWSAWRKNRRRVAAGTAGTIRASEWPLPAVEVCTTVIPRSMGDWFVVGVRAASIHHHHGQAGGLRACNPCAGCEKPKGGLLISGLE